MNNRPEIDVLWSRGYNQDNQGLSWPKIIGKNEPRIQDIWSDIS